MSQIVLLLVIKGILPDNVTDVTVRVITQRGRRHGGGRSGSIFYRFSRRFCLLFRSRVRLPTGVFVSELLVRPRRRFHRTSSESCQEGESSNCCHITVSYFRQPLFATWEQKRENDFRFSRLSHTLFLSPLCQLCSQRISAKISATLGESRDTMDGLSPIQ